MPSQWQDPEFQKLSAEQLMKTGIKFAENGDFEKARKAYGVLRFNDIKRADRLMTRLVKRELGLGLNWDEIMEALDNGEMTLKDVRKELDLSYVKKTPATKKQARIRAAIENQAYELFKSKKWSEAARTYEHLQMLSDDDNDLAVYTYYLAICHAMQEKYYEAYDELAKSINYLDRPDYRQLDFRGYLTLVADHPFDSIKDFNEAKAVCASFKSKVKRNRCMPSILLGIAISEDKLGNSEKARKSYEELLKIDGRWRKGFVQYTDYFWDKRSRLIVDKFLEKMKK